jgi:glycosyltransferase involved in cell wall biosynthesis
MTKKLLYLGNKLSQKGYNLTYIETLGVLLEKEGYSVVYASDKKNQLFRMLDMIYTTLINIRKVDTIIIDTYSTFSFYYALIISAICRLFNKKYIPILHGGKLPQRLKSSPYLSDFIFKNAYRLVAPSNYLFDAFKNKYAKNLIFIPNVIEIDKYIFQKREYEFPKLFWVRSFSEIYNPKMAIEVLSIIKKEYPKARLCMVGPDKENLISLCKEYAKELNVEVEFTGKLDNAVWLDLSKGYNVFINTTHFDNTPISVIEAMALGLPIVSTNVGGIPFLLQNNENSLLVNDSDSLAMANAIKEVFLNPELNDFRIKNARLLVESFDWNMIRNNWLEILK